MTLCVLGVMVNPQKYTRRVSQGFRSSSSRARTGHRCVAESHRHHSYRPGTPKPVETRGILETVR